MHRHTVAICTIKSIPNDERRRNILNFKMTERFKFRRTWKKTHWQSLPKNEEPARTSSNTLETGNETQNSRENQLKIPGKMQMFQNKMLQKIKLKNTEKKLGNLSRPSSFIFLKKQTVRRGPHKWESLRPKPSPEQQLLLPAGRKAWPWRRCSSGWLFGCLFV